MMEEGFDEVAEDAVPEALQCPVCKEVVVAPQLFPCGMVI
jgi:hypothetical protein